jgi:hypothetical protein
MWKSKLEGVREMKKFLIAGAVAMIALLIVGAASFAYAQTQNPPGAGAQFGPGMMRRGNRSFGPGMMGGWGGGMMGGGYGSYGPMHTYMLEAFAAELGSTPEEVQTRIEDGETMWEIAQSTGLTDEEITDLMLAARSEALTQMVADGVITQEQADWRLERMNQMHTGGFGSGNCPMAGPGSGNGPGGRWDRQPGASQ